MTPFEQYAAHCIAGWISGWAGKERGIYLAALAGLLKELYDQWSYGGFDWIDLLFTVLGGVAARLVAKKL